MIIIVIRSYYNNLWHYADEYMTLLIRLVHGMYLCLCYIDTNYFYVCNNQVLQDELCCLLQRDHEKGGNSRTVNGKETATFRCKAIKIHNVRTECIYILYNLYACNYTCNCHYFIIRKYTFSANIAQYVCGENTIYCCSNS